MEQNIALVHEGAKKFLTYNGTRYIGMRALSPSVLVPSLSRQSRNADPSISQIAVPLSGGNRLTVAKDLVEREPSNTGRILTDIIYSTLMLRKVALDRHTVIVVHVADEPDRPKGNMLAVHWNYGIEKTS